MRVTFLTHYYPPEVGAPQARISALAAGLSARGAEVAVHTCLPHYPDGIVAEPYRRRALVRERLDGVRVIRSAVYPAANRGFARRLADHASFAASALATAPAAPPADVVVVETPPLFLAGAAIAYARMKRAKLIANVADLWPDSAIELGSLSSPAAIRSARALERAVYRASAAITCPTRGILDQLERRPESTGKARQMPPSVDLDRFRAAPPPADGRHAVLYAGTLGLAQGVGTLIQAAAELAARPDGQEIEVRVAGDGAEGEALREEAARIGSNVRMLGLVPADEVPALYRDAHAAVVLLRDRPLFRGALPTKMFEAMAAGRPVVLSGAGEAADLLAESGAGLTVSPEDPLALADALEGLAEDPDRARELGAAGRRWVEAHHGRESWIQAWWELLESA